MSWRTESIDRCSLLLDYSKWAKKIDLTDDFDIECWNECCVGNVVSLPNVFLGAANSQETRLCVH